MNIMGIEQTGQKQEDRNVIIRDIIKKALKDMPEPRNDYDIDVPSVEEIKEKLIASERESKTAAGEYNFGPKVTKGKGANTKMFDKDMFMVDEENKKVRMDEEK